MAAKNFSHSKPSSSTRQGRNIRYGAPLALAAGLLSRVNSLRVRRLRLMERASALVV